MLRFAIVGSGAVGGYFGAKLVQAGHEVTFLARGAHLEALRRQGLEIRAPSGDVRVPVRAESDPAHVGPGGPRPERPGLIPGIQEQLSNIGISWRSGQPLLSPRVEIAPACGVSLPPHPDERPR